MTATISGSSLGERVRVTPRQHVAGERVVRGREAERRIVRDLLQRAQRGAGGVALVEGEPGIGKSLLLRDCADEAAQQGFSLTSGAADQVGQAIPFFALRTVMHEPSAGITTDGPGRGLLAATEWHIAQIRSSLQQRAALGPILVCLDDLHWASAATLAALRVLPRDLKWHPVAWLLARSSTHQNNADSLFTLLEKEGASRCTLTPLAEDTVTAMLTEAFGARPGDALAQLARGAAGNPRLLSELIGGLHDDRAVQVIGGRTVLVSDQLPERIHRLARQWVNGLSDPARHLLTAATVLDPAFRLEDVAEMIGEAPAKLLPAVEEAMGAAILTAAEHTFIFRHELLRRAVGEMIPPPARKALHRQYGDILLTRGSSADAAAGHLLQAAGPGDPASLAGLDVAAAKTLGTAPQTASRLAVRALELTSPADPDALSRAVAAAEALTAAGRLRHGARIAGDLLASPLPVVAEARLRCVQSTMLGASGRSQDAADQAEMVLGRPRLAGTVRDQALTAQLQALAGLRDDQAMAAAGKVLSAPGQHDSPTTAAALVARAVISWDHGQISDGLGWLRDAARDGTGVSPDARHVQPLLGLAAALVDLRELGEAEDVLRAAQSPVLRDIPAHAALLVLRARIHLAAGRLDDAARVGRAALAAAEKLGADGYITTAHSVLSMIALRRGDIAAAAQHLDSRFTTGRQFADIYARAETMTAEAQITEARGGPAAVSGHLRQFCDDLRARSGLLLGDPGVAAWLVRTALAAGEDDLATRVIHTAQVLADSHPGFPALAAAAAHGQGLVHRDPGRLAEAATRLPDPWARASAAEDLGVLYRSEGTREQAIRYLEEALHLYARAGADRDQARIRQRLRKLGIRHRHWTTRSDRPVTGWDSLTSTEQAVAGLVAQGLKNSEIAARMYISTHTVAHHLRQIFRKLSIASRVELARIVIEQAADASLLAARRRPRVSGGQERYVAIWGASGYRSASVRPPRTRGPDASATRTPGIRTGPGTRRRWPSPPRPESRTSQKLRPERTDRDRCQGT